MGIQTTKQKKRQEENLIRTFSLVTLAIVFALLIPKGGFGKAINLTGTIAVDNNTWMEKDPGSFVVTEDGLFLFPDETQGKVRFYERDNNKLRYVVDLGRSGLGTERFIKPVHCFYFPKENRVGVFDKGAKMIFIYDRHQAGFELKKQFDCPYGAYDIEFSGDGEYLIVSGFLHDTNNNPFELYSINIRTGEIQPFLPSYRKYHLKNQDEYYSEYRVKQSIPPRGLNGFIDVQGDELFFVWEGALPVLKINLKSKDITGFGGREKGNFFQPRDSKLAEYYKKGEFGTARKELLNYALVRNLFTTQDAVYVIYETAQQKGFRVQGHGLKGNFLFDQELSGKLSKRMYLDKTTVKLYCFSESGQGETANNILIYEIK